MGDHELVVFGQHRREDKTQADEDGSHDEQNARAIRVEDLTNDRREKELVGEFVIQCPRRIIKGRNMVHTVRKSWTDPIQLIA